MKLEINEGYGLDPCAPRKGSNGYTLFNITQSPLVSIYITEWKRRKPCHFLISDQSPLHIHTLDSLSYSTHSIKVPYAPWLPSAI